MVTTGQTLRPLLWRAERLHPDKEIVSRTPAGIVRYTYEEYAARTAQLANALDAAGIGDGDRAATFCWNHHRHFETYFGVPNLGGQLHTINPLLPDEHVEYIVENAGDRVVFVDPSLIEKLEGPADSAAFESVEQFVVMGESVPDTSLDPVTDYETFVGEYEPAYDWPRLPDDQPAGMCYTSGTTGKPKGVEYTQRMLWAHTMATLIPQGLGIEESDVVMPVVPMFHVNAWGLPYSTTAAGAKHVYPGPAPEPADLAALVEQEGVTITAGVPTVWLGLLEYLDEHDADLSSLETIIVGGSAAPQSLIRTFDEEYDVEVLHAWGMTEMSPIGTVSHLKSKMADWPDDRKDEKQAKQGLIVPGLEFTVVGDDGEEVPWNSAERRSADHSSGQGPREDGEDFGELWVRGPWVVDEYFERPDASEADFQGVPASEASGESEERSSSGKWLKTGDIVTVDEEGYVQIVDRAKDVIKSGGEWISSVELENALMAHDDVTEATVIGVPHERWQERPVAFVVPAGDVGGDALKSELIELIQADYPKWWAPDDVLFIDAIPKTATGKFDKKVLREEYDDESLVAGKAPEEAAPEE